MAVKDGLPDPYKTMLSLTRFNDEKQMYESISGSKETDEEGT